LQRVLNTNVRQLPLYFAFKLDNGQQIPLQPSSCRR
jgi:hypothetical protein